MKYGEFAGILTCVATLCLVLPPRTEAAPVNGVDLQFSLEAELFTVTVSGQVKDKRTGVPIADALVRGHLVVWKYGHADMFERAPSGQTRTDAQGNYKLVFITPLTAAGPMKGQDGLCVYASAPGYETKPIYGEPRVTPENTEYPDFNFELEPGQRMAGTVIDAEGRPVPDATIRLQSSDNADWDFFGSLGLTTTNDKGQFELWVAKGGERQWLTILKQGVGFSFLWDNLDQGDLGTVVLNRGGRIQGRVVDAAGKGVAGCEVSVRNSFCDLIDKVLTDSDGRYLLQGVPGDPSMIEFYKRKNGDSQDALAQALAKAEIRACLDPALSPASTPKFKILARDGETVTAPDLGGNARVSGRLRAAHHLYSLGGLMVRLDDDWDTMVKTDADGNFQFPGAAPGKHRLTAYLPHNLRYDRGIGQTEINVPSGQPLTGVQFELDNLAEVHVQYLDADGNPLPDITAGAVWLPDGAGGWTEGTCSDADGRAVLYLYPDEVQYVRGYDFAGSLVPEGCEKVQPRPGQILDNLRIVMIPSARLEGALIDPDGAPLAGKDVQCIVNTADDTREYKWVVTDAEGCFKLEKLPPGIARLSLEIGSVMFADVTGQAFELKPGAVLDLGRIVLKNGLDEEAVIREKHAHALDYAAEVRQAAEQFFEKIQTADYASYLRGDFAWRGFPLCDYYQTVTGFPDLVRWICTTFLKNPIVKVELGKVFLTPEEINGKKNLPTVPYKLTLQDGTRLEGNLPFELVFWGDVPRWYALHGIDWHLSQPKP